MRFYSTFWLSYVINLSSLSIFSVAFVSQFGRIDIIN